MAMSKYNILVPIEYSDISVKAIEEALLLAGTKNGTLYLFRVGDTKMLGKFGRRDTLTKALDAALDEMDKMLRAAIINVAKRQPIDLDKIGLIHKRFATGTPENEILKMASNISSQSIVVGMSTSLDEDYEKGKSVFHGDFVGGLATKVPCNMTLVRTYDETFVVV